MTADLANKPHTAKDHSAAEVGEVKHTSDIIACQTLLAQIPEIVSTFQLFKEKEKSPSMKKKHTHTTLTLGASEGP